MKLIDFVSKCYTNHFKLRIVYSDARVVEKYYDDLPYNFCEGLRDHDIISIDCTTEIEKESQITHTISIRPILLVSIRG